jgi:hypothetical protein
MRKEKSNFADLQRRETIIFLQEREAENGGCTKVHWLITRQTKNEKGEAQE